jgi:proteasome lid subunit RPN8/RPN11
MKMRRADAQAVLDEARAGYPFEVCGVLLGRGGAVSAVVPVANAETRVPRVRYRIAPEDLVRIQRDARGAGLEIVGYYHSHPDHPARPSPTDRRRAALGLSDGVVHVIVGVDGAGRASATAWVYREATGEFEAAALEVE